MTRTKTEPKSLISTHESLKKSNFAQFRKFSMEKKVRREYLFDVSSQNKFTAMFTVLNSNKNKALTKQIKNTHQQKEQRSTTTTK